MKILICILLISFSFEGFAQENSISGFIPHHAIDSVKTTIFNINKENYFNNVAYGYSWGTMKTFSVPILPGFPFTYYEVWGGLMAYSMCLGGNGHYYLVYLNNILEFNPITKEIGLENHYITGLVPEDDVTGIAYNSVNDKYYLTAGDLYYHQDNLYELNINTYEATLIGPTGTGGIQIDLTFDCEGTCYSYDIITNNSYIIDINTGTATLLGPLGFNPSYSQGMDYDRENHVVYLSAFDSTTWHAQLRELDITTGETVLIADWGENEEISAFTISTKCYNDCSLEASGNPYPPSGSYGIPMALDSIRWENDPGVTDTKVYFGKIENIQLVYDGPAINSFPVPPLEDQSLYTWRIRSGNGNCSRYSPVWLFGTMENPDTVCVFEDEFENGLGNWTITNINGDCDWEIYQPPFSNHYILPSASSGSVLAADADNCGAQTTVNSTATINQSLDFSLYNWVWLEFDSDWKTVHSQSKISIEVSLNNGSTWTTIWEQEGNEIRTSSEIVDASLICAEKSGVKFRLHADEQDWDWWWVIDNLKIYGMKCPTCVPRTPTNLHAQVYVHLLHLFWTDNSYNEDGFKIERKEGDSLSTNQYEVIDSTLQNITSFIDSSAVPEILYTYRIYGFNQNGNSSPSNCASIMLIIPVELISFTATQVGNNVELNWRTATELNDFGFEVQRQIFMNDKITDWVTIGFKKGYGTTTKPKDYSFHDEISQINADSLSYRLKQVDYDGNSTFSQNVNLKIQKIPIDYKLYDNFPNPFNPTTRIRWESPSNGWQTLKIYDVLGREIRTLVNGYLLAGKYDTEFNATNLPSGIYFYRFISGSFVQMKKMILLK